MILVSALFVHPTGPYPGIPGVDPWGLGCVPSRDARTYTGPHPVVAHPPCAAWGRYARPTPESTARGPLVGDDGGCFASAFRHVNRYGGVIEHPADTKAFAAHRIRAPLPLPTWSPAGVLLPHRRTWVTWVDQGRYGHEARKPTWLYVVLPVGVEPPMLDWNVANPHPRGGTSPRRGIIERMSHRQRAVTPHTFAMLLVSIAMMSV